MKHHYPVRALSLLCALAIFVSLIPAALAAAPTAEQLENHIVKDTVTPAGIQINLFDYWVRSQTENDTGDSAQDNTGINKDHHLRFTNHESGAINAYTHSAAPCPKIVQNQLKDGYPVLTAGKSTGVSNLNNGQTTEESLAYLFDQSEETETNGVKGGTLGKKTYWDVGGLLRIDDDGYYYYNADHNKSKAVGGSYQSANYAYFDEGSKTFKVYDTWGIKKVGAGEQQGQFFPFTNPSTANVFTVDDSTGALKANESTNSKSNGVNHFFGVSMTTRFIQRYGGMTSQQKGKAMTFEFAGDDDVWIFIDGVLVADLGGIHDQASTKIDFSTGKIYINGNDTNETLKSKIDPTSTDTKAWRDNTFADNTYHTLKLFYLERGGTDSNLAMKFNLAYVPETDGIKVDQNGTLLPGVQFDLYAATKDEETDAYTVDTTKGDNKDGLLATGTTDSGGRFVLNDDTGGHISLNELTDKHHVEYLILQEQPEGREGYRRDENIYLVLTSNGTVSILFNDMEHRWTTGTYAGLKGSISTNESVQLINADRSDYKPETEVTGEDGNVLISTDGKAHLAAGGTLFAVIMRRLDNVGTSVPSDNDTWGVVTGSALSGWRVYERGTGQAGYREAVIKALNAGAADNGNAVAFKLTTNGAYMAELKYCPGDLREYYYWTGNIVNDSNEKDTAYSVAFFYTTGDLAEASLDNTYPVDGSGFERQFAATIYIPNVKHYLNVQKVDETGKAVPEATFSLYEKDDLTITGTGWSVKEGKSAYDTVITGRDGKAQFPSAGKGVLAEGQYYLVENSAPVGYKVNATAVPVIVDDTHGVMADAGNDNDGVAVTVAEGHLVPTMTPFATVDDIDRTLTNITTTRMEAESGWDPTLEKAEPERTVDLMLDTESFKKDHPVQTLRYIPVNEENESLSWRTETGWLWFHIEQTPIADNDPGKNLKTNLGNRDLTRLFTGETTVIVTNQRVGTLAVSKTVDNTTTEDLSSNSYEIEIGLNDKTYSGIVNCTSKIGTADATNVTLNFASGKVTYQIKGGETLTLLDLPVGTAWTVEETETLDSNRWRTTVSSSEHLYGSTASGTIARADRDAVVITNRYAHYDEYTAAVTEQFKVTKIYTAGGEHSIYPGRVSFVLKDANGSAIQTIFVDGEARAEFDALRFDHTGTYTYTVEEVNGLVDGMQYDPTLYTVDITVTVNDAEHCLDAAVTWRDNAYDAEKGLTFTNTYTEPDPEDAVVEDALNVRKQYAAGSSDPAHVTTLFQIEAVTENAPMPNETQIHILGAHSGSFGSLVFNKAGTYVYHVTEIPAHLLGLQCDSTVYTVTFVVTKADGKLTAAVSYAIGETEYLYSEAGNVLTFTNAFENKAEELKHASLSLTKAIGEGIDADTLFDFRIEVNGASGSYDATQNGTASSVTFTDGKATVQLKGGETLLIKGLPDAALYTIQETTTGYTVAKTGDTGTLSGGQTAKAHFTNTKSGSGENPKPNPEPAPEPGDGGNGGTPALNRRDHYAYIIGYPDGDVHPQGNITRAEVATIFFRLLRDPVRTQYWSQTNGYSDVPGNKWYNNAISTLSNMGIICGYPDGTFRPDAPITRAELTKIAASFFSDPRVAATYDGRFSDVHGAEWYISYLMTALEEGLIEGYPDGSFRPNRPITRAETCTIVNRTLGRKPEKDHLLPESDMINWPDNINRNIWYYAQMQEATNSHDYRWISIGSEACEQWTAKLIERDWAALERTWSHANSAPGGEVMQ